MQTYKLELGNIVIDIFYISITTPPNVPLTNIVFKSESVIDISQLIDTNITIKFHNNILYDMFNIYNTYYVKEENKYLIFGKEIKDE